MTQTSEPNGCIIWPSHPADRAPVRGDSTKRRISSSPRVGTDYVISKVVALNLFNELNTGRLRARLTTLLLNAYLRGDPEPEVTFDMIELAKNASPLRADERADRLLRHLVDLSPNIGVPVSLGLNHQAVGTVFTTATDSALAWSESEDFDELMFLIEHLQTIGFVKFNEIEEFTFNVTVTVQGHAHIADQSTPSNSSQAFVAMWFDDSMDAVYHDAIAPAIQAAGYEPYRIDRDNFLNKIDDEIIAQIRQSKFLLADFTHAPEGGVRGSVYYEAGSAYGLGIPCIFTARNDADLQFDTRQFPHILWKPNDLNALKHELTYRILALPELGRGPNAPLQP